MKSKNCKVRIKACGALADLPIQMYINVDSTFPKTCHLITHCLAELAMRVSNDEQLSNAEYMYREQYISRVRVKQVNTRRSKLYKEKGGVKKVCHFHLALKSHFIEFTDFLFFFFPVHISFSPPLLLLLSFLIKMNSWF